MVEEEAYASREAWAHSIGLSQATHQELQTHRDHVYAHETYLQAYQTQLQLQSTLIQTHHQAHMVETLRVIRDMRREMSDMQADLLALQEQQRRARQPGPDARIPDHQDTSGDADNGSHSSHEDNRRNVQTARPCFYADFMKCQPLNFKGTEGVVGLTRWIEKMESVFNISGCAIENQVKFATYTLLGAALTWWNELTLICTKFVANKTEKVDKYISGLPDNIYGNVKSARPKTLDETIELANDLMHQKLRTYAERQTENKRKADDSSRNNHGYQQQPFKRQNVAKVYNMGTGERKPYGGSLPKCTKCHLHHNGPCTQKCHKCKKVGHFDRDCRSTGNTNVANNQKGNRAALKGNGCFKRGAPGHFKRDYLKLKNEDGGNGNAQGSVYAVGNAEKRRNASGNPDANVVTVVMSSASSAVTYTFVYTDSEPGRAFWGADDEEDEDEREPMFIQAHDLDYVSKPIYPEYIPLEDEHEFLAEEQPLSPIDSPTAESPGYVTESDPEEDPEEYEDDETEDGPVDYPMDGGDDDNGDSSRDDANDEDEDEEEEEEEEHLALADSAIVVPTDEPVSPPEGTELVIPPPSTDITIGARISVRPQTSISLPPEAEVERLLAMTTPSPSPPISLSPPSAGERLVRCMAPPAHSSPPPVPSPLLPSSGCPTQIQTLRIASTQALIDAVTVALPSPPLPPSLYIPPPVDRRDDIPESEQPPRKRLCLSTLGSRYEIGESSTARPTRGRGIDYGFVSTVDAEERQQGIRDVRYIIRDTWVDPAEAVPEIAPMTVEEVNTRVTELAELHEHDTQDLYALLEDAQDSRSRISQRVDMDSQWVDLLMGDRMTLQETVWMVEEEAYASREAWAHSIGLSTSDTATAVWYSHSDTTSARQPAPDARIPDHQDASRDADSHVYSHEDNRRNVQTARPCFYADFMKCQPLNFKGTEGVVGLTRWIEKMESVFNISGCAIENQVKFATCTLLGAALTWWNGQIRTLGPEAYAMTWEVLKKKMTDKYCPQGEIKKLEIELWNLKVKGNDVPAYTERFQELTLICTKFVANETEKVDKYISGLPDNIYGNVKSARPKTLDETIELANDLMDQKLRTYAERQSDNKRKADDSSRNNHGHQQQPFKRQNVAKVYNMGTGEIYSNLVSPHKGQNYTR
ncbi:putative reverse transcriptase domain-containing protein [Tanacetum coccineum]